MRRTGRPRRRLPKLQRIAALKRDYWRCTVCGCDDTRELEIHHKDGHHTNHTLSNLQTLCKRHHAHVEGRRWPSQEFIDTMKDWRAYAKSLAHA